MELNVKYLSAGLNSIQVPTLQEPHWFGENCVWPQLFSVMIRATASACVLSQYFTVKLKMVHVRLYSAGRGGKAFQQNIGSVWKFRDFVDYLRILKISQLIYLKCSIRPGPIYTHTVLVCLIYKKGCY